MENKKVQLIYNYLVTLINDKEIDDLIMYLRDYTKNGSMQDYEVEDKHLMEVKEVLEKIEKEMK